MNAVGACGLQLYRFGEAVSIVFFTGGVQGFINGGWAAELAWLRSSTLQACPPRSRMPSQETTAPCV